MTAHSDTNYFFVFFFPGSTLVKVKVIKDNHSFFIHIIDPQIRLTDEEESFGSLEEHEIKPGN